MALFVTKNFIFLKKEARVYSGILPNLYHTGRRHDPICGDLHSHRTGHLKICAAASLFLSLCTGFRMAAEQNPCQRSAVLGRQLLRQCCPPVGLLVTVRRSKSTFISGEYRYIRSSGRITGRRLYPPARPDLRIRIRHSSCPSGHPPTIRPTIRPAIRPHVVGFCIFVKFETGDKNLSRNSKFC